MTARDGFRNAIELAQQSARLANIFVPGRGLFCDFQELDHKIESFRLFQYASRELNFAVEQNPLEESVRRALGAEAFRAIWILEGVGHIKGAAVGFASKALLADRAGFQLPPRALISLHAGMGTAFGEKIFANLGFSPSTSEVDDAVARFLQMCRDNCAPGWEDACIEPLGLVIRCLYPSLLTQVSEAMERQKPSLRLLFWHGVGRSLYFIPTNFLPIPGAHGRMLRGAISEAIRVTDRRNVLAGLVWAMTLVNLRQPEILRGCLGLASELKIGPEFTNGVLSALLAWRHMAPDDMRYIGKYRSGLAASTTPGGADAELWSTLVEQPAVSALAETFPGLDRNNKIPALYTFRTSEELRELSAATVEK